MDTQVKILTSLVNQVSLKLEQFEMSNVFDYKQYSDLTLELNQINAEAVLIIQQAINIDVSQLFDKIFTCLHNLIQHAIKCKVHSQKLNNKSQTMQVEQCISCINMSLSQNIFGGVPISKQGNPSMKVKASTQVPWYDSSQTTNTQQAKKFVDKHTCTSEDYYSNCYKVSSESYERQIEFESMIQFANESIAIMGEALSSRVLQTYKEKGKPEELNKLVHAIKFKKDDIDSVMKSVDLELLKDKIENYDQVEEQIRQHILQVQKKTADKVFQYCKQLLKEKIKGGRLHSQDQIYRSSTLMKGEECRCQVYISEIMSLQNKTEQQQQQVKQQQSEVKDKERIIQSMELQLKLFENQMKTQILEKQELKQKLDQQGNYARRSTVLQRQSSFMINQLEDQQDQNTLQSPNRKVSREDRPQLSSKMQRSQVLQPFSLQSLPILQETINTDQMTELIKKDQMLERLIILTNALDKGNKEKRLSQLQYVVEQKGERQLADMYDLIRDIEDNDLLMKDAKSVVQSQYELDDAKSPINVQKQYHSQHIIDANEASQKQRFQSSRDLNSPKTLYLEQIKEIDENKHILLIPIEQDQSKRRNSRNTSQSSFNDSNQVADAVSPENKQIVNIKPKLKRTQSNAQQQFESKNGKMKRTSSIKLKINRKVSSQINKSNDLLSNPYGASTIIPQNTASLTERLQQRTGQEQEDQFKFEKALENEEIYNKSPANNKSQHDKTFTNQIQSGMTTQHHTPNNSSRQYKLKAYNQNSDKFENLSFKQVSNSKDNTLGSSQTHEQTKQNYKGTVQNPQSTKFQLVQEQQQDILQVQQENENLIKRQSKATHNPILSTDSSQQQPHWQKTQEMSQLNINLHEIKQQQIQSQDHSQQNEEIENTDKNLNPLRKVSRQNKSPESAIKTMANEQVSASTFRQQMLNKFQQSSEKPQSKTHRTQTSADNNEGKQVQDVFIRDYINKQKDEYEKKLKEERMMFDQHLYEIAEQQEDIIIKNALNNTQGYMISQDINDTIMKQMYKNLKDNGTQISQTINHFYSRAEQANVDFREFQNFVNKFQNLHKRCGKDCIHVTRYILIQNRFYMRLGFVSIKYLNKRKAMKLAKPVVLPGFPKVAQ